jgi:pyruvate dehydrogenase E1 component beta subunit
MDTTIRELSYSQAIQEAMAIAMERDDRVFLMGEDIGVYGGAFQVTGDLVHRFGEDRVMDTPISELGGAGVAVGAALTGMRPIFEFQFSDFAALAMEQIVNQAAKIRYMLGGAVSVPLVMRFPAGSGTGAAAQHSQSLEAWLGHVPGLKVLQPATPYDAKGMLLAAVEDPDPVMIFEHKLLYKTKGPVPEGFYTVPIGKAEVVREGRDLTIVATAIMVHKALDAAAELAKEGIDVEVIDLRTVRPIDRETIIKSVKKTSKLLCVYEAVKTLGIGAEISAIVAESDAFDYLDAPIVRLGGAETPIPYNPDLERATVPQVPDILKSARDLAKGVRSPWLWKSFSPRSIWIWRRGRFRDGLLKMAIPSRKVSFSLKLRLTRRRWKSMRQHRVLSRISVQLKGLLCLSVKLSPGFMLKVKSVTASQHPSLKSQLLLHP